MIYVENTYNIRRYVILYAENTQKIRIIYADMSFCTHDIRRKYAWSSLLMKGGKEGD